MLYIICFKGDTVLVKYYAQFGEDIVIDAILKAIDIDKYNHNDITYVDCGSNHPVNTSNTYFFYEKGVSGILVEPNLQLGKEIRQIRPKDKLIQAVVSDKYNDELDFFVPPNDSLSSVTQSMVENFYEKKDNINIRNELKREVVKNFHINDVLAKAPLLNKLWFLSVDCEGYDDAIIQAIDFKRFKPNVIVYERKHNINCDHPDDSSGDTYGILIKNNYVRVCMTLANSIFVLESNLLENKVNKACKSLLKKFCDKKIMIYERKKYRGKIKRFFRLAYYKKKLAKYILKIFYK